MPRGSRLTNTATFFLLSLLLCPFTTAEERPNIIFVMADDLGYGDLGCYGQKQIQTPNLDQMAEDGLRFTNAYAGSTVCAPSRCVLMTGQHTGHCTVRGNIGKSLKIGDPCSGGSQGLRVPLKTTDITLAKALRERGYTTGMAGKWGLGEASSSGHPNRQGFDRWFGFLNQRRAHDHYPKYLWSNTTQVWFSNNTGQQTGVYSHDRFTEFAVDFIQQNSEQPFFLYLPYCVPHSKFQVPTLGDYANKPWSAEEKKYAAMVSRLDSDLGTIFRLLSDLKIDEKTIVFFCSDNGAANRYEGRFDSSGHLRGRKRDLYEGGLRVPMIVRWPGHAPAGRVLNTPWWFADVFPTCLELAGVNTDNANRTQPKEADDIDGISVIKLLTGKVESLPPRQMYWEFHERGFGQAARLGNWKCIQVDDQPLELYDLATDEAETTDVAGQHPTLVEEFSEYFRVERTESSAWPLKKI